MSVPDYFQWYPCESCKGIAVRPLCPMCARAEGKADAFSEALEDALAWNHYDLVKVFRQKMREARGE